MTEQHYNPILYQSLSNGPNGVYSPAQSSPAQLVGAPNTSGYHIGHGMAMYNGGVPRYPVQMGLAQKFQQQQQQQQHQQQQAQQQQAQQQQQQHQSLTHQHLQQHSHHQAQIRQQSGLSSPATIPASLTPQLGAATTHYQQQVHYANLSRQSAAPHYRARAAAAVARSSGLSSAVTITDPNNPSKTATVNGEGADKTGSGASSANGQQWTTLDLGGMGLKNISRELFQYTFLTTLYINHNNLHHLSPEISRLTSLTILDVSGNKLIAIPPELGMLTSLKELLLVDNGLMTLPFELGTLYQLEILALEGNPLNESLKNLLHQDGTGAVINYLRENCPVPMPPPEREWITLEDNDSTATSGQDTFTVFCYNILAENYATPQMYGYTPSWALAWEYRKELILQEVLAYSADIVCLQEVELGQYEDYFREQMKQQADYESIFWPKSRAKTMHEKDRRNVDGCATFFKASKFTLIEKHLVEFNHVALQRPDFRKTEDIFNRVMTKDQISVITLLEHKDTKNRVIVANAHIYWDPAFKDVKLVQVAMLMDELDKLSAQWTQLPGAAANIAGSNGKLPTLICGDFNSVSSSGVYEFLTKGAVAQGHDDFGDHAYGTYTSEGLAHKMTLKSAYSHVDELSFTNYTPTFEAVIDHIFYSSNYLNVLGLLGGVEKEYMSRVVGFPNAHFPSDHIPILSEFKFRTQGLSKGTTVPNFGTTGSSSSGGNRSSSGGANGAGNNSSNSNSSHANGSK